QLIDNSIDWRRASLIIRALQIAVRNARNVHFGRNRRRMVREVPNWDRQWMVEHGETPLTPPLTAPPANEHSVSPHPSATAKDSATAEDKSRPSASKQSSFPQSQSKNSLEHCHPERSEGSAVSKPASPASAFASPDLNSPITCHPDPLTCHPERGEASAVPASIGPTGDSQPPTQALSSRQARQWRELRRVQRSMAGARHGNLDDLKRVMAYAGLDNSSS
ncbi:MAG TPA: hypothetical protein VL135_07900, partial [Terracidiphilus sp.]|nr:hypothetical protein [Terracidiphilus sp.]